MFATGAVAGTAAGLVGGDLKLAAAVPASIIVVGAARGVGEAFHIGIRAKLLAWMGVEDPRASAGSDEVKP